MQTYVLGILFSGGGTTAEAIVKAIQNHQFNHISLGCAISSDPEAKGIERLTRLAVPVFVINPRDFKTPEGKRDTTSFGEKILRTFNHYHVNLVTQNGWLPLTPQNVVHTYENMIFNQHPGPVPEFGGKGMVGLVVHEAILRFQKKAGRNFPTEVVAHRVTTGLDDGAIVQKIKVPIFPDDTALTLQTRSLPKEHENQINLLSDIDQDRLTDLAPRKIPLIKPSEEKLLQEAKDEAINEYKNH